MFLNFLLDGLDQRWSGQIKIRAIFIYYYKMTRCQILENETKQNERLDKAEHLCYQLII